MKIVVITKDRISKPSIKGFDIHNYLWDGFGNKDLNLRDYDGIILDLTELDEKASGINWVVFSKLLGFEVTKDVLMEASSFIIVIGNPFTSGGEYNVAELLGVKLRLIEGKGESIKKTKHFETSKYKNYLQHIKSYQYSFDQPNGVQEIKYNAERLGYRHIVDSTEYLITKAGKVIAAQLEPIIYQGSNAGIRRNEIGIYKGKLVFLPISELDRSESIRLLLEVNKEVDSDSPEPEWVRSIEVVGEDNVNGKISDQQSIIEEATDFKNVLLSELAELRKPLDVLYKSDKHLEESIKDLLKTIGAIIIEPETSDKVEFYIKLNELKFVVEVKSTINATIDKKGLRQVVDWQNDAFDITGEDYKPLVITSTQYDKPLDIRNSEILPPNLIEYSTKKGIAVITVVSLYKASQDIIKGNINVDSLLNQLNSVSGLYEYSSVENGK